MTHPELIFTTIVLLGIWGAGILFLAGVAWLMELIGGTK